MRLIGISLILIAVLSSGALARVGGGDITFETEDAGNVVFSHDAHVGKLGPTCTQCHASLYLTREKHQKTTMEQMQNGLSCGACHNGKTAFSVEDNCEKCHKQ